MTTFESIHKKETNKQNLSNNCDILATLAIELYTLVTTKFEKQTGLDPLNHLSELVCVDFLKDYFSHICKSHLSLYYVVQPKKLFKSAVILKCHIDIPSKKAIGLYLSNSKEVPDEAVRLLISKISTTISEIKAL